MDVEKGPQSVRASSPFLDSSNTHVEQPADAVLETDKQTSPQDKPVGPPPPPPNGGLLAWMQVAGSFFLFFNCWGTVNTFGVFQTYYENNPYWKRSPSDISWIGSIQAFLLLVVGVFTGPIYDLGYFKTLVASGTFLISFGFMMTSLSREYWQVMLAQGLVVGLGNGCLWVPSVAIIPQYFSTKKAFASGVAAAGSSVGGIVYPIAFHHLQQTVGFPWATRVMGFIALATLSFSLIVMKQRVMPRQKRKLYDLAAFKELPYTLYCVGMFLAFASFYGPIYYIQPYAIAHKLTNENMVFYLLPILNAASVPGRIIPNFVADYIGPYNILFPASGIGAILIFCWIAVHSFGGVLAFAITYGFFSGAIVSIAPVGVVVLTKDLSKMGTRMGQAFFVVSFGLLIGTPVVGAIVADTKSYLGMQLFCGIILFATSMTFLATKVAMVGFKILAKA